VATVLAKTPKGKDACRKSFSSGKGFFINFNNRAEAYLQGFY
jgi:hypothetical protein